eukprot:GHRR01033327.1.p1 GENE.GHRR01033327.1~~GHRR01033327.1.p1  ORF type:complete len:148 (+),score=32.90 GHRR01033327.1:166-609(+)
MSDLPRLHASSTRLILGLRDGLERLEATEHGLRPGDPSILAKDLQVKLAELQRISRELDSSWRMALVRQQTAKHDVWKRQVTAWQKAIRLTAALPAATSLDFVCVNVLKHLLLTALVMVHGVQETEQSPDMVSHVATVSSSSTSNMV